MFLIKPVSTNPLYRNQNRAFRYLTVVYKAMHVVLGLDFGFVEVKTLRSKVILKVITLAFCSAACVCCSFNLYFTLDTALFVWFNTYMFEYLSLVLCLVLTKGNSTICNLFHDLRAIDSGLKVNPAAYKLERKLLLSIFLTVMHRVCLYTVYCAYFNNCSLNFFDGLLVGLCLMSSDIIVVTYAFVFYAISCRLRRLSWLLKEEARDFVSKQHLYKSIVDVAEKHRRAYVPVSIITLLFNIPHVMITMYSTLRLMQVNKENLDSIIIKYVDLTAALEMVTLMLMPAVFAGKITTQAERIKVVLHDALLLPQGEAEYEDVQRFIGYVEARPCRLRVCKLIPLDADLISMVLHFCVTYLIVIIQFTNT